MEKVKENKTTCTFSCIYISSVIKNKKNLITVKLLTTNQPTNQPMNEIINQPVNQPANQTIN
jgi:hypothetical protein